MKLKENMVLTEIGDGYAAVPLGGEADDFRGIVRLNETAAEIWRGLSEGLEEQAIAERLLEKYDGIDLPKAKSVVHQIVEQLAKEGLLEV